MLSKKTEYLPKNKGKMSRTIKALIQLNIFDLPDNCIKNHRVYILNLGKALHTHDTLGADDQYNEYHRKRDHIFNLRGHIQGRDIVDHA